MSIATDWNGKDRNWLLTAFKQNKSTRKRLMKNAPLSNITFGNGTLSIPELAVVNNSIGENLEYFNPAVVPIAGNTIEDINRNANSGVLEGHVEKSEYSPDAAPLSFINTTDIQNLQNSHIFTPSEIGRMTPKEFSQNEAEIMRQVKEGLIQNQIPQVNYSGYTNPANGSNQIYSREDIGSMTLDEYSQNEQAIQAQLRTIGIPTNNELQSAVQNNGGLIYVNPYTRTDGTQVRGYYRAR